MDFPPWQFCARGQGWRSNVLHSVSFCMRLRGLKMVGRLVVPPMLHQTVRSALPRCAQRKPRALRSDYLLRPVPSPPVAFNFMLELLWALDAVFDRNKD